MALYTITVLAFTATIATMFVSLFPTVTIAYFYGAGTVEVGAIMVMP
jgi:hypothetical protein